MSATNTTTAGWWDRTLSNAGATGMEKLLPADASWEEILRLGRLDLQRGLEFTKVTPSREQTVIDIGCGIGRMTQVLGEHYGRVIGVDISAKLLAEARQRNRADHIEFELLTDGRLQLQTVDTVDAIFSYEVLYLLPPEALVTYMRDAYQLLAPEGTFFFQLNLHPMTWKTHFARQIRQGLLRVGVQQWRGWPNDIRRYPYDRKWVCQQLAEAGFRVARVCGDDIKQMWFVARKPE